MPRRPLAAALVLAARWIPVVLLLLIFVPQGWAKFSDTSGWAAAFRHWGYPDWFRVAIGVVELTAAALLLLGPAAIAGAFLIVCVMLGGMATHVAFDHGRHMTSEVVPLTLALLVLVLRRRDVADVVARVRHGARRQAAA